MWYLKGERPSLNDVQYNKRKHNWQHITKNYMTSATDIRTTVILPQGHMAEAQYTTREKIVNPPLPSSQDQRRIMESPK